MGRYEEDLVDAMVALCRDEPSCDRLMFVLPAGRMDLTALLRPEMSVTRAGDVVVVRRGLGDVPVE